MMGRDSLDFSFSGLKTAVLYHVHGPGKTQGGLARLNDVQVNDICASFSAAVCDVLVEKTRRAVERCGVQTILIGGGVAANSFLRAQLVELAEKHSWALHLTPMRYCTDNAAMIAALGGRLYQSGQIDNLELTASASQ